MYKSIIIILCSFLLTYSYAQSSSTQEIEYLTSILWSEFHDVQIQENYAFATMESGLKIYDISNPSNPIVISQLFLNTKNSFDITLEGNFAYIYSSSSGEIFLIDISNQFDPILVSTYESGLKIDEMLIINKFGYVNKGNQGLSIINFTDYTDPQIVYNLNRGIIDFVYHNNHGFISSYNNNILIYDLSIPTNPILIDSILNNNYIEQFIIWDTLLIGHFNYDIQFFNFSNILQPTYISSYNTKGHLFDLEAHDNYLFLVTYINHFEVVNFEDVNNPTQVKLVDIPFSEKLRVADNSAFVRSYNGSLQIIDITNPENSSLVKNLHKGDIKNVEIQGDIIYVTSSFEDSTFLISIDYTDFQNPLMLDTLMISGAVEATFITTDRIYLGSNNSEINIVNITNPSALSIVSEIQQVGNVLQIIVKDKYLYTITDNPFSLNIFDVSNELSSNLIYSENYNARRYQFEIVDNFIYISCYNHIEIMDISNIYNPIQLGNFSYGEAFLKSYDNYLFNCKRRAMQNRSDLMVYNIDIPDNPNIINSIMVDGYAFDLNINNHFAYICNDRYGFQAVNISNFENMKATNPFLSSGWPIDVAIKDSIAFVAEESSLLLLKVPFLVSAKSEIESNFLFAFQTGNIDNQTIKLSINKISHNYSIFDIDQGSIVINDSLSPFSINLISEDDNSILELNVLISDLLENYLPFWDTTYAFIRINGKLNDGNDFIATNNITLRGRLSGDINNDNTIDSTDLLLLIEYLFKNNNSIDIQAADVNHDGSIFINDLTQLINIIYN